jgi:hypothetical protein
MWNWDSLLLQPASSILDPASHAGILLAKRQARKGHQHARDQQILGKHSHCRHTVSMFCDIG